MRFYPLLLTLILGLGLAQHAHTSPQASPERSFLSAMIAHHEGALEMALEALTTAKDRRVLDLARDIILAQAQEMHAFRLWLLK